MNKIELIKDVKALTSTCYIELSPGEYKKKHWETHNVFFTEDNFSFIQGIIEKHDHDFSYYSINEVKKDTWLNIIDDFKQFKRQLTTAQHVDDFYEFRVFRHEDLEEKFQDNFDDCRLYMMQMLDETVTWLEEQLKTNDTVSILGM